MSFVCVIFLSMFFVCIAIGSVAITPDLIVVTTYNHKLGGMGTPPEQITDIDIYYHGTPNAWVEIYVDNYFIVGNYTNSVGNISAYCRASSNYPNFSSDCPHRNGPNSKYMVDAYEGGLPALTLNVYCPAPCPN